MRVEGYGYLWWFWAVGGYNKKGSNKLLLNTYINTLMQREIPTRSRFSSLENVCNQITEPNKLQEITGKNELLYQLETTKGGYIPQNSAN